MGSAYGLVCYDRAMDVKAEIIVAVNAGSSSIKLAAFSRLEMLRELDISISDIGQPVAKLRVMRRGMLVQTKELQEVDYAAASGIVIEELGKEASEDSIGAIGHRLVHGGGKYDSPVVAVDISEGDWELFSRLDPSHTPAARQLVSYFMQQYPAAMQVACFDTAFFHDLPQVAKVLPIPKRYYEAGVRRYGFHGLAYTSLLSTFREKAGEAAVNGRVILAHLGSGAGVTATRLRRPVDTTMGFTPASGIAMGTRSGDLDPGVFSFLNRQNNMGVDEFDYMVNFESGLLGVSGITGDMYSLLQLEKENEDAVLAVELFVRGVKKSIGAYAALLGGVDSLIFSGGIGEQSALIRSRICQGLEYLGIEIDDAANQNNEFLISSGGSRAGVHVIAADEARVIAGETVKVMGR